jgi:drug/metabolite transporter (DMT)-like permease
MSNPQPGGVRKQLPITQIDLAMLCVALIWGVNFTIVKQTIAEMMPMVFISLRFVLASAFVLTVLKLRGEDLRFAWADLGRIVLMGFVGNTLYQFFFIQGIARTTASNSSVLLATSPIFVTLLSALLHLERTSLTMWLGVLLSFAGTVLIVGMGAGGGLSLGSDALVGNLLTLCATLCWSVYTLTAKPLLRHYSPLKLTALSMMVGTLLLVLISAGDLAQQRWELVSWRGWLGLGYSFVFANGIAYIVWNTSVHRVGNVRTVVISNVTPVIAVIVSGVFLGDALGVWQMAGVALTLLGVTLTRLRPTGRAARLRNQDE